MARCCQYLNSQLSWPDKEQLNTKHKGKTLLVDDTKAFFKVQNYYSFEILLKLFLLKFMFSKKATKIDEIFTINLMLCSKRQIDNEDFINFLGLLREYELYLIVK